MSLQLLKQDHLPYQTNSTTKEGITGYFSILDSLQG